MIFKSTKGIKLKKKAGTDVVETMTKLLQLSVELWHILILFMMMNELAISGLRHQPVNHLSTAENVDK